MSVRGELKSIKILLEETREQHVPLTGENAIGLADRLAGLSARIEQQPQFSAVRPATIALRNLLMSLRRPELSLEIDQEIESAIEAIVELLADETFGFEGDDLRTQIVAALRARGVQACATCRHADLSFEPVYLLVKPFPSDPALAPSQMPCALAVCKRCGATSIHDLGVLGVVPRQATRL